MGTLVYGSAGSRVAVDDRALAHLKVVIVTKFRRSEAFLLSWTVPAELGSGRGSLWLHPSIPLRFEFGGVRPPALNRAWLEEMTLAASTSAGLAIGEEPPEQADRLPAMPR